MLNFFIQQQIREYDTVEKTVKNIYQSIDNKAKVKNYFEANKKKKKYKKDLKSVT